MINCLESFSVRPVDHLAGSAKSPPLALAELARRRFGVNFRNLLKEDYWPSAEATGHECALCICGFRIPQQRAALFPQL